MVLGITKKSATTWRLGVLDADAPAQNFSDLALAESGFKDQGFQLLTDVHLSGLSTVWYDLPALL